MLTESTQATLEHIREVQRQMMGFCTELQRRAIVHDQSKLSPEEHDYFEAATPKLKGLTYGSPEYKASLAEIRPALDHHNANNSHHPEHYSNGIRGFDLFDFVEMWCDWNAAVKRHADGDILKSIEHNKGRFGFPEELCDMMRNTASRYMGKLAIGSLVTIESPEGISGPAKIVAERPDNGGRYKVRMEDNGINEGQEFWAHNFEIVEMRPS